MANSKAQAAIGVVFGIGPKASAYSGPTISVTATTTSGSAALTAVSPNTTGLAVGMPVSGTGIAAGSVISAIGSSTTLTLSKNATATGSAVTLTVSVFVTVGEVSEAPLSGQKWDLEEITNFDSLQYKEFLKTLLDSGKVAIKANRVSTNAGQVLLKAAFIDPNGYMFQMTLPLDVDQVTTGDTVVYSGLVEQYDDTVAVGKAIKLSVSIQRTGIPVYTEGA